MDNLSGKYNFHSLYKNVPAYIREADNEKFYLAFYPDNTSKWYIQKDDGLCFLKTKSKNGGIFQLKTNGKEVRCAQCAIILFLGSHVIHDFIPETNPLNLDSVWQLGDGKKWVYEATIKIFSDEKKFQEYQKTLKKK